MVVKRLNYRYDCQWKFHPGQPELFISTIIFIVIVDLNANLNRCKST